MAFAAHAFSLGAIQDDGHPLIVHLEHVAETTGHRPAELDGPELPPACAHVWTWYVALDRARGSNGFAVNPIGWCDVQAWAELTGNRPTPWEVESIMALDLAYRAEIGKRK